LRNLTAAQPCRHRAALLGLLAVARQGIEPAALRRAKAKSAQGSNAHNFCMLRLP
jgi:hypothetical protein